MANYLGRAAAYAMHKKYPSGSQTARQLAAERANLKAARLARGQSRSTGSASYHAMRVTTMKSRGTMGAQRAYKMQDIMRFKKRPLGVRYLKYKAKTPLRKPRITGIKKKFIARKSSARYLGGSAWGASRTHKFRKRLVSRQHRFKQIKRWKHHGNRYTPR
jgi:hypothetical protein